jgi:CRP/FNR family cyclic AMP-dependent transcriptional regulator
MRFGGQIPILGHPFDKIHNSCKVLNSAHTCTLDRSNLKFVENVIKHRHNRAALEPKAVLIDAAKAAKAPKRAPARPKASATKSANGAFAPMEFLAKVGAGRTIVELSKGEAVFAQGDAATAIFYVQQGRVRISVISKAGKEATVALLGAGNFLGEECIAAPNVHRVTSATALTNSTILRIERDEMIRVLHEEQAFSEVFVAYLLARNARTQEDLVDQLFNSSEKRLARALLLLAQFGKDGTAPETVIPKISQEVLAEMIGTTRARVNFFMNRFRQLGFIDYNGKLTIHTSLLNVILHD